MPEKNWYRVPVDAQSVDAPLSLAAVFLVVTVADSFCVANADRDSSALTCNPVD
jgi:hypothetical protein